MPRRKSANRPAQSSQDPADERPSRAAAPESDGNEASHHDATPIGWRYHVRQHAGLVLGLLSIILAAATFDANSEWAVTKMMCCLTLCMVGMMVHEIRPYQRRGYGSVWLERLTAGVSDIGRGGGAAVPTAHFGRSVQTRC